jgi:hypothetical protein
LQGAHLAGHLIDLLVHPIELRDQSLQSGHSLGVLLHVHSRAGLWYKLTLGGVFVSAK